MKYGIRLVALAIALTAVVSYAQDAPKFEPTEYMVEMRDGVSLATDVFLPEGEGPWPAVVSRTPYNKQSYLNGAARYVDAGFAYVSQDSRGKFRSEGEYYPFESDMPDGFDTIEWTAAQPWCDGNVGISGASAMGIASNHAAAANPPHLKAAFVVVAPQSLFSESRFIGGVFKESHAGGWMRAQGAGDQVPGMKKRVVMDDHWRATDFVHHRHKIDIPMYNVGGWYDIFSQGNIDNFKYLQEQGLPGARGNQKLLMGPFGHGEISGGLEYPDGGSLRSAFGDEEIRWFDHWLKDEDTGIMDEDPVRYYMMASAEKGAASPKNTWITSDTWPPRSKPTRFYIGPDGGLSLDAPGPEGGSTTYKFDPADPVPTVGGLNLRIAKGPMDQRDVGERGDYLRFETPMLTEDVMIAGKIDFELYAATDGLDTDFMVKLVDVYPSGYEAIVIDNPIRTRYRNGRNAEDVEMMTPGEVVKLHIDLWSSAITFEKGHKIAVHITSSNFPRFEVNANTGEEPGEDSIPPRVAANSVHHSSTYPSAIILPVIAE